MNRSEAAVALLPGVCRGRTVADRAGFRGGGWQRGPQWRGEGVAACGLPRRLIGLLAALLLAVAQLASAQVPDALLEQAETLLAEGRAEQAYQLLEPHETAAAGDAVFDYLLASAALDSGRPSRATFIFERILAASPGFVGVRADMGRAYFALGDYGRAKIEFETVLSVANLPQDLYHQVLQYLKLAEARAAAKRTTFTGFIEAGVGHDSNIGSATSQSPIYLPFMGGMYTPSPPVGLRTGDRYGTLGLGGEINHMLNERWSLYAGADYRLRNYKRYKEPNYWTLDTRAGFSYSGGSWLLRSGVLAGTYYYHGKHLRDSIGVDADWRMARGTSSQLTASASFVRNRYARADMRDQDVNLLTLSAGWLTALGDGSLVFSAALTGGHEWATGRRDDGNRRFLGPALTLQKSFGERLGGFVMVSVIRSVHQGTNSFYLHPRRETLMDVTAGLTWRLGRGVSLQPMVSYTKNRSNAALYAYSKRDVSLTLRYDF